MPPEIGIIDFHSHILPHADHGSDGLKTSAEQLRLLSGAGVGVVIATPHFYPESHTVESFLARRSKAAEELRSSLPEGSPKIILGAEVLLCEGLDRMDGLSELCIEGTKAILLEMPMHRWSDGLIETVERISELGLTPIMAHVDRYPLREVERFYELDGTYFQLNAPSLCKLFGKRDYLKMVDSGAAVAIGSDLHMTDTAAVRSFSAALRSLGSERVKKIMKKSAELAGL